MKPRSRRRPGVGSLSVVVGWALGGCCYWAVGIALAEAGQCVFRQVRVRSMVVVEAGCVTMVDQCVRPPVCPSDRGNTHSHPTALHQRRPRLALHPRADGRL